MDLGQLADLAYRAEVDEFNESGGLMDQYTSALGGVVYIEAEPKIKVKKLSCNLGAFVLGDSLQKKDTQDILGKSKEKVIDIVNRIKAERRDFSFHNIFSSEISNMEFLDKHERLLITETIENRDITLEGLRLLEEKEIDSNKFGSLLNRQHAILRDTLKVSTEKIDDMLEAALSAGAVGGKINGSGGGGCMFVYAPDLLEEVVGRLLSKTKATVAVAESCTGGQVASLITNAPGSSAYFIEGVKYIPKEEYNYDKDGLATFYGKELHNVKTINNDLNKVTELLGRHKIFINDTTFLHKPTLDFFWCLVKLF